MASSVLKTNIFVGESSLGKIPPSTLEFFEDGQRSAPVRSSPLVVLEDCKRKFLYEYRWGIKPKGLDSALTIGSLVHLVLASLFQGETKEQALKAAEVSLAQYREKLQSWVDKAGFLPNGKELRESLAQLEEDYHKAVAMGFCFWHYCPFPADEWEVLKDPDGNPMVERILELEPADYSCSLRTPCDLVLRNKKSGKIWIADFKTSAFDPKLRSIMTKFSVQLKLYRLVLQRHLDSWGRGEVVAGSIHAFIKKPGIKFCGKDANLEAYIQRLIQWYADQVKKDPDNPPLMRDPNTFHGPLIDAELNERLSNYEAYATTDDLNLGMFYRNDSACLKFNRPCPYMTLCNSSPALWPMLVRDRYQISFREDEEDSES